MLTKSQAPNQWCLGKHETIKVLKQETKYIIHTFILSKFRPLFRWQRSVAKGDCKVSPSRDFTDDGDDISEGICNTKQ